MFLIKEPTCGAGGQGGQQGWGLSHPEPGWTLREDVQVEHSRNKRQLSSSAHAGGSSMLPDDPALNPAPLPPSPIPPWGRPPTCILTLTK